jgi:membrane protein implicated in regulation of membrane protease activity
VSQRGFKIYESLWVDRSDFVNGLNFIFLLYGLAVLITEVVFPESANWIKFVRFYFTTVIAMWLVKRNVYKLAKTPQRVDSSTPNSPSS